MFFAKVDQWVGKTLFLPLIIKFCQLTRQSQFACSRLFWFISALDGFYHADTIVSSVLWAGISVLMMITATRRADAPTNSVMVFRLLCLAFLLYDVMKSSMTGILAGSEFWLLVLIAEYAATIRTLPPQVSEQSREDLVPRSDRTASRIKSRRVQSSNLHSRSTAIAFQARKSARAANVCFGWKADIQESRKARAQSN